MEYNDYLKGFCALSEIRGQFEFFRCETFCDRDSWLLYIKKRLLSLCINCTESVKFKLSSLYGLLLSYTYMTFSDMALDDIESKILDSFDSLLDFYKEGIDV